MIYMNNYHESQKHTVSPNPGIYISATEITPIIDFYGNRLSTLEVTHFKFLVLPGVKGRSLQCPTIFWQIKRHSPQSRNC